MEYIISRGKDRLENCDGIDGISSTWEELSSSLSCMHEMEISTNLNSEITGNVIFQFIIIRFQS